MPIEDEGQYKIKDLIKNLATNQNINSIKYIDPESVYRKLQASELSRINCIDLIQYLRHIVSYYNKKKVNIVKDLKYQRTLILDIDRLAGDLLKSAINLVDEIINHLNDIIFLFRKNIESTSVELDTFNIQTLVKDIISRLKIISEEEICNVEIQDMVIGDSFRIRAVLSQLIGSAIINQGGKITINANFSQNLKILQFTVQNIGESIPKEKLQKINAELENQDLTIHQELGEGLAFIKHLTLQMKGSLRVAEQSNYITFSFEVPIQL